MKTTDTWAALSRRGWMRLAGAAAMGAAALGAILPEPASAADKVTVGALRFTSHAPSFIALERGYFADEGLEVELKFFQAAQPVAVAIASGDIDFGVTALTGGFFNLADKGALKVVAGLYAEDPSANGTALLASNQAFEAGLKTPADLKGRSFGMTQQGSSFHYQAALFAEANGFSVEDMDLKPLQKVGSMIGALKSGQVDAIAMVPHIAAALDASGAAHIIGWLKDMGPYQVTTVFTSTENATENRDMVERFLRAYQRGVEDYAAAFLAETPDPATTDAMVELIHGYVYADQPLEQAAASIKAGAVYMSTDLDVADVEKQLAWFKAHGLAPEGLTTEELVDASYVPTN
ncbi:ABC transporter substrate-binding protein [Albimonas pacifica]|uniref:NitT/TauT family transport system substrate-binding protein n=1 Tax=Albimonas pacifica TaxID=1114924 RepID=A0A1I3CRH6_9RHOB|nr:ABC transporter substrate-binding protein [Albimonas pacifica]SFH77122.1 NitT/TauT family transport system substrate-binding protein [Albimonas pacifica]